MSQFSIRNIETLDDHEKPVVNADRKLIEARLQRTPALDKYDFIIQSRGR